jgi:hypothetical protein
MLAVEDRTHVTRSGEVWLFAKAAVLVGTGVAVLLVSSAVIGIALIVVGVGGYAVFKARAG